MLGLYLVVKVMSLASVLVAGDSYKLVESPVSRVPAAWALKNMIRRFYAADGLCMFGWSWQARIAIRTASSWSRLDTP